MRYLPRRAILILILAIVAGPATGQAADPRNPASTYDSQIEKKQRELAGVRQRIGEAGETAREAGKQAAALEVAVRQADTRLGELRKKLESIRAQLEALTASRRGTEADIRRLAIQLARTTEELDRAKENVKRDQAILDRRARDVYVAGRVQYYEVLLASKSFSDFLNRAQFLGLILDNDGRLLERVRAHKALVEEKKELQESAKRALQVRRTELAAKERRTAALERQHRLRKAELETELQKKSDLLAEARATRAAALETEAQLKRSSGQITQLIRRLEARAADARRAEARNAEQRRRSGAGRAEAPGSTGGPEVPLRIGRGGLIWPTAGPLTSGFGFRLHPLLEYVRMHEGVDIGAPSGQPIYAAKSGVVIFAGWYNGYGNTVIVDHGNGLSTLYAHAAEVYAGEGSRVAPGELVAAVGSTGFSTGPHLHFEVRVDGVPTDPMAYF